MSKEKTTARPEHTANEWLAGYDKEWETWYVYSLPEEHMSFPGFFQKIAECGDNDTSENNAKKIASDHNAYDPKRIAELEAKGAMFDELVERITQEASTGECRCSPYDWCSYCFACHLQDKAKELTDNG